jgi:hypothetical protein
MGFPSRSRNWAQRVINEYGAATGRDVFLPGEFVDWIEGQPDHEAYPIFFGRDDATMARERRIDIARRMASGLRITVKSVAAERRSIIHVVERTFPMMVSPLDGRRGGGGYVQVDPSDAASMAELRRQGAQSLSSWLERYGGAFRAAGYDLSVIEELAGERRAPVAVAAE